MTDTHTDAQAAALDEAIEAAAVAIAEFHIEFMGARKTTATLARVTSASMKQAAAAVRAAAPIIRRQAEAERDEARAEVYRINDYFQAARARLADAERDALLQAADDLLSALPLGSAHAALYAEWLREQAKAAGAAQAEPGEER